MAIFARKPYPTSASTQTIGAAYRRLLRKHPFAVFGLPFVTTMLAGSFFLTPATAVRYERFDRKTHMLDREEALGLKGKWDGKKEGGRADIREEYWRLAGQGEKLDDWEPKRIKRLPGEPDGTFD